MPTTVFPAAAPGIHIASSKGDMLRLINDYDWGRTSLGPMPTWPSGLLVTVRVMLASHVPMVMLMGPEGVMIYNDAYSIFAGKRHPRLLGSPVLEGWPEVAEFNRHVMDVCMAGNTLSFEAQRLTLYRNNLPEDVWMDLDYSPVLGEDGVPLGVVAIVYDTTKRVMTERALARSEESLSFALEAAGMVGIWDWDIVADRVVADNRFAEMYGVEPARAAAGAPLGEFVNGVHPDDREGLETKINQALRDLADFRMEYRLLGSDGEIRWVLALGRAIAGDDGKAVRLPGVVIDITESKTAQAALTESEAKFRAIADSMPQMVWSTLPDGQHDYFNARWYDFTGVPVGSTDGEGWNGVFHPDDQERAWTEWRHSLATGEPYQIEYRLKHRSGDYRWVLGRALPVRDDSGRIIRWMGTCTDIHESRQIAEEREVVAQELSHRIKNIFSVLTGIISLSARSHPEAKEFASQLRERVFAMGVAHDFVRPHSENSRPADPQTSLRALVEKLLAPFSTGERQPILFSGPDATIDDAAATPVALLFHELATNSAKYGALSEHDGTVSLTSSLEDEIYRMEWRERGSGQAERPTQEGFGTRLMKLSVEGQLQGTLEREWTDEGLTVTLRVPVAALRRSDRLRKRSERTA